MPLRWVASRGRQERQRRRASCARHANGSRARGGGGEALGPSSRHRYVPAQKIAEERPPTAPEVVLPDPYHSPTLPPEHPRDSPIASPGLVYLRCPKCLMRHGDTTTTGATMPETPIEKDDDHVSGKNEIRTPRET